MGFKDFRNLISEKLKKSGFEIAAAPTDYQWDSLFDEEDYNTYVPDSDIKFASVQSCEAEKEELELSDIKDDDIEKIRNFRDKYKKIKINSLAFDIPSFFSNKILINCSLLKKEKKDYLEENNKEFYSVCKNLFQIKSEAINLFRIEGTSEYEEKAIAFVTKYMMPSLAYGDEVRIKTEKEILEDEAEDICEELSDGMNEAAKKIAEEYLTSVAKAKPTIEYLIENIYTQKRKEKSEELFKTSIASVTKILPTISSDPAKVQKIEEGYSKLKLAWFDKPDATAYVKDPNTGLDVLKDADDKYTKMSHFLDGNLSFFTSINASYSPQFSVGNLSEGETVNMMPAFLEMLETSPYSFLSVVAHEVGHKIGPRVSKVNGHDLKEDWKSLVACYSNKDSINLLAGQHEEAIADYLSSMVLSDILERLPADERRAALKSSMKDFCLFDDSNIQSESIDCKSNHPESSLRINGIYGANPKLRNAVGCNGPSSQFKSCALNKGSF